MAKALIRVYVVAEFELLRIGLLEAISHAADMEVAGGGSSLDQMVGDQAFRDADVLIIDAEAVNRASIAAVRRQLAEWVPALRVLFIGTPADAKAIAPDDIPAYMAMGTVGFLYKTGPVDRIIEAVRMIACGSFVCETDLIRRILTRLAHWANEPEEARAETLSDREMEVLALVALGRSNKEISKELFVAEGTIKAHISHIMAKLRVERRTDLVRYALTSGFARLNDEAS